tara:strand:+ start:357 stop:491 length:135 start_codon:yes stop_codon:yes gene_type:complete
MNLRARRSAPGLIPPTWALQGKTEFEKNESENCREDKPNRRFLS